MLRPVDWRYSISTVTPRIARSATGEAKHLPGFLSLRLPPRKPSPSHTRFTMRITLLTLGALLAANTFAAAPATQTIPLPGNGGWDYLAADSDARRLYVTHATRVQVLDLDTQKLLGEITPTPGVHGVALDPALHLGFISNGGDATVTVFDTATLKTVRTLKVEGSKPDAILYEPFSKRVFTFNGDSANTTAFDAATGKPAGAIDLGGGPEFSVSDGAGTAYVNIEDKGEVVRFDPVALKVTARWPLAPAHTPTGLALDTTAHRLLVGCRSKHLVVLDSATGKTVATLPIGAGVDAVALDAPHSRAFVSCGDGSLSVVKWNKEGVYSIDRTIKTRPGAKTVAYDAKTQKLYLSCYLGNAKAKENFGLLAVDVSEVAAK